MDSGQEVWFSLQRPDREYGVSHTLEFMQETVKFMKPVTRLDIMTLRMHGIKNMQYVADV